MEDSSIMLSIQTPFEEQGSEAPLGEYAVETDVCSPFGADGDAYANKSVCRESSQTAPADESRSSESRVSESEIPLIRERVCCLVS